MNLPLSILRTVCVGALTASGFAAAAPAIAQTAISAPSYLQLVDRLDRPEDGYCLDVVGHAGRYAFDRPLVAHNCKPNQAEDGIVEHRADGSLRYPAFDLCVTAMGGGRTVLPGISLALRNCGVTTGINKPEIQQRFEFLANGKLNLIGSDLCLEAGPRSAETVSPFHRWRPLYMAVCDTADPARTAWALVPPLN